jgi:hypothetical protein
MKYFLFSNQYDYYICDNIIDILYVLKPEKSLENFTLSDYLDSKNWSLISITIDEEILFGDYMCLDISKNKVAFPEITEKDFHNYIKDKYEGLY